MINTDLENALKVMIGSQEAEAMYVGSSLLWSDTPQVPYDSKVEYLESTGIQYINTGIIANPGEISFTVDCTINNNSGSSVYVKGGLHYIYNSSGNGIRTGGSSYIPYISGDRVLITAYYDNQNKRVISIDNSIVTGSSYNASSGEFVLLRVINESNCIGRIYRAKVYLNSILVRDLIPIRVNQTGYMYDKVTKQLFGNNGTGDFVLGPDIVEIEYLQSSGTQYIDTGIIPDANTGIYLKASRSGNVDNYAVGLRNNSGDTRWCIGRSGHGWYWGYGTYDSTQGTHLSNQANIVECKLNYLNDSKWSGMGDDNTSIESTLSTLSFTPAYNIRLFGSAGESSGYSSYTGKIYAVKISQESDIIMDLVPVRVGQVGYMYDKISNKLYGSSSGDFILGPDKT